MIGRRGIKESLLMSECLYINWFSINFVLTSKNNLNLLYEITNIINSLYEFFHYKNGVNSYFVNRPQ